MKRKQSTIIILSIILLITIGICIYLFLNRPSQVVTTPKTEEEVLVDKGIKMVSKETFVKEVNELLNKGYNVDEINQIYEYMSEKNITEILKSPYTNLSSFFQISNFDFSKIERYKAYQATQGLDMKDTVTRVNINLDEPFYTTINEIEEPEAVTVLVNKSHTLKEDYVPSDLQNIPSFPNLKLRSVAIDDFEKLIAAAKLDGVYMTPYSTYRSYDYQKGLYEKYLKTDSQETVDTYSARPGHSEHQTGLAIDIKSNSHWYNLTDADYEWMKNNSYKYGFIIRYPKDNSEITGYKEEPWHIRYVGIEVATKVQQLNITYDEYYDLYIEQY